jgi:hypothetical protein
MVKTYVYDGTTAGRPSIEISETPPEGFCASCHDNLMRSLDARGWWRELATRLRQAEIGARYDDDDLAEMKREGWPPVADPAEMDRLMCRDEPIAVVRNEMDLKIAELNSRLVVEIDTDAHNDVLIRVLKAMFDVKRGQTTPRRQSFKPWADHRILSLLELKLSGHDPDNHRKQLACWLFPEIKDEIARGHKFDDACDHLDRALASLGLLKTRPE